VKVLGVMAKWRRMASSVRNSIVGLPNRHGPYLAGLERMFGHENYAGMRKSNLVASTWVLQPRRLDKTAGGTEGVTGTAYITPETCTYSQKLICNARILMIALN
jgi:hypothetical protein